MKNSSLNNQLSFEKQKELLTPYIGKNVIYNKSLYILKCIYTIKNSLTENNNIQNSSIRYYCKLTNIDSPNNKGINVSIDLVSIP